MKNRSLINYYYILKFLILMTLILNLCNLTVAFKVNLEKVFKYQALYKNIRTEFHLSNFSESGYSINTILNYNVDRIQLGGKFSVIPTANHGIIMTIQSINLRSYSNQTCRDYLEFSKGNEDKISICGTGITDLFYPDSIKALSKNIILTKKSNTIQNNEDDTEPEIKSDYDILTFKGSLNQILNFTLFTGSKILNESYAKSKNGFSLVFTLFSENCEDKYKCNTGGIIEECIDKKLYCDGLINCANQFGQDELTDCPQEEENKAFRWGKINETRRFYTNMMLNLDVEEKYMREERNMLPIYIMLGFMGGISVIVFGVCQWLAKSEAGKLIKNYGIREGLRQSFRRSRRAQRARPRPRPIVGGPADNDLSGLSADASLESALNADQEYPNKNEFENFGQLQLQLKDKDEKNDLSKSK